MILHIINMSFHFLSLASFYLSVRLIHGVLSDKCTVLLCVIWALFFVCCRGGRRSSKKRYQYQRHWVRHSFK